MPERWMRRGRLPASGSMPWGYLAMSIGMAPQPKARQIDHSASQAPESSET